MNKQTKMVEYKLEKINLIQISTMQQLITTNKHLSLLRTQTDPEGHLQPPVGSTDLVK